MKILLTLLLALVAWKWLLSPLLFLRPSRQKKAEPPSASFEGEKVKDADFEDLSGGDE
ncbi:MAG: hypothetical protein QF492_04545 [Candidatus Krumholzibacteria bacterium]|jgi:hypothetical protein|nr:hypothetical protein [Candidatus Krumholzibacteria bacterium]MDP6669162.1 hypothetical protein [Candidatus Krumholzibacteria bacterium]MDP6797412.1 hypothetical protein [Candidatus Krumholzibacteria bacterium]MDP7020870.1 hypothetical protein [Candidatus Krumholzibacteria bacterium]